MNSFRRLLGYILNGLGTLLAVNTVIQPFALYFGEGQPLWVALLSAPACLVGGILLVALGTHLLEGPSRYHGPVADMLGTGLMWAIFAIVFFGGFAIVIATFLSPVAPVGIMLFVFWLAAVKALWEHCRDG